MTKKQSGKQMQFIVEEMKTKQSYQFQAAIIFALRRNIEAKAQRISEKNLSQYSEFVCDDNSKKQI